MNKNTIITSLSLLVSSTAFAMHDYQVTGPVTAVNANSITVQKGKDSWELDRDANTKGMENVKVGDKVTIYYGMTAQKVEVKSGNAKSKKK